MNNKYIFGGIIIVVFLGIMGYLFTQTNIKYEEDFAKIREMAKRKGKIVRKMDIDGVEKVKEVEFEA